jgi:hypothetical protein
MEPVRERQATVNDLLDRLLDKGVIVSLDLVIGVAGIPLIGVSLRAAIAAIETMIEYGFMKTWDEKTRQYAERELQRKKLALAPGESTLLEMFGSHWYSDGIYRAWRPGRLYLTDRRLILYRKMPAEVLFETPLGSIRGLGVAESVHFNTRRAPLLHLALESGEEASLYTEDVTGLEAALRDRLGALGVALTETITGTGSPCQRDREVARVAPEARVLAEGKMWHQTPGVTDIVAIWRPGWLYLTGQGLLWWSESQRRLAVRIPVEDIVGVAVEPRDLGPLLGAKSVLGVRSGQNGRREAALFAGESLDEWRRAIRRLVVDHEGEGRP